MKPFIRPQMRRAHHPKTRHPASAVSKKALRQAMYDHSEWLRHQRLNAEEARRSA